MKEYTENRVAPRLVLAAAIVLGLSCQQAQAQVLELQIVNGLVTLDARDVSLKQILAAWTEVGGTQMINADKLSDAPVTLQFARAPELVVLEALLRDVAGYVLGPWSAEPTGDASVGRIVILPTSSPVGSNAVLPSGGFASPASAPDPDSGAGLQAFQSGGPAVGASGQASPELSETSRRPVLFEPPAETVEIPGPGPAPGVQAFPGASVPPNPFGVTSGSSAPTTMDVQEGAVSH